MTSSSTAIPSIDPPASRQRHSCRQCSARNGLILVIVAVDHACPVAAAQELGLLSGSPVEPSWCLSYRRDLVMGLLRLEATDPDLLLWQQGPFSVRYAPWDWVNTHARVMLVVITPGAHQASEALREAQACLRAGCSNEETLRRARTLSGPSPALRA
jgi:hypothetical protein